MSFVHEVAGGLRKMFVADAALAIGILGVVSLTGAPMRYAVLSALAGGAMLFAGCVLVLVASVLAACRPRCGR